MYVLNLDEHFDIAAHWIALYTVNNNVNYLDSFGVEHIPRKVKIFIDLSIVVTNIFRIQAYDAVICGYFCIGFIDFMLNGKALTGFTNLFSPNNFKQKKKVMYFKTI